MAFNFIQHIFVGGEDDLVVTEEVYDLEEAIVNPFSSASHRHSSSVVSFPFVDEQSDDSAGNQSGNARKHKKSTSFSRINEINTVSHQTGEEYEPEKDDKKKFRAFGTNLGKKGTWKRVSSIAEEDFEGFELEESNIPEGSGDSKTLTSSEQGSSVKKAHRRRMPLSGNWGTIKSGFNLISQTLSAPPGGSIPTSRGDVNLEQQPNQREQSLHRVKNNWERQVAHTASMQLAIGTIMELQQRLRHCHSKIEELLRQNNKAMRSARRLARQKKRRHEQGPPVQPPMIASERRSIVSPARSSESRGRSQDGRYVSTAARKHRFFDPDKDSPVSMPHSRTGSFRSTSSRSTSPMPVVPGNSRIRQLSLPPPKGQGSRPSATKRDSLNSNTSSTVMRSNFAPMKGPIGMREKFKHHMQQQIDELQEKLSAESRQRARAEQALAEKEALIGALRRELRRGKSPMHLHQSSSSWSANSRQGGNESAEQNAAFLAAIEQSLDALHQHMTKTAIKTERAAGALARTRESISKLGINLPKVSSITNAHSPMDQPLTALDEVSVSINELDLANQTSNDLAITVSKIERALKRWRSYGNSPDWLHRVSPGPTDDANSQGTVESVAEMEDQEEEDDELAAMTKSELTEEAYQYEILVRKVQQVTVGVRRKFQARIQALEQRCQDLDYANMELCLENKVLCDRLHQKCPRKLRNQQKTVLDQRSVHKKSMLKNYESEGTIYHC